MTLKKEEACVQQSGQTLLECGSFTEILGAMKTNSVSICFIQVNAEVMPVQRQFHVLLMEGAIFWLRCKKVLGFC